MLTFSIKQSTDGNSFSLIVISFSLLVLLYDLLFTAHSLMQAISYPLSPVAMRIFCSQIDER
jgi:hypothetical protein